MLENLKTGLSVMGIGMSTTFVVLIVLMAFISLMGYIIKVMFRAPKPVEKAMEPAIEPVVESAAEPTQADIQPAAIYADDELAAVISAALAAYYESANSSRRLVVRSIRRVTNWSKN